MSQIEAYYGVQQAEMLSEAQMIAAMQALNIQQQQLNAEEAARMQELDMDEMQAQQAQSAVTQAPMPQAGGAHFCPNCGAPIALGAHFCEGCGQRLN